MSSTSNQGFNTDTQNPLPFVVEPNPVTFSRMLWLANIPSGVTESEVVENLRKYGPFEYISSDHLTAGARLKPDSFYQASTGGLAVIYPTVEDMERALVCFETAAFKVMHGISISLSRDMMALPKRDPNAVPLVMVPTGSADTLIPSTEDVYDVARRWGSIRALSVAPLENHQWVCRVEFWHPGENTRFHEEFVRSGGRIGSHVVGVFRDEGVRWNSGLGLYEPYPSAPPIGHGNAQSNSGGGQCGPCPNMPRIPFGPLVPFSGNLPVPPLAYHAPEHYMAAYPEAGLLMDPRLRAYSMGTTRPIAIVPDARAATLPLPYRPLPAVFEPSPMPSRPLLVWNEVPGILANGGYGIVGLRDQYAGSIPHTKGQHIRKVQGDNHSTGREGYKDFCNLRVKGLGPDVNDLYLREMCQMFTGFMGSRVARDDRMRHKGYGFANYETVTQAKAAMEALQGRKCGSHTLVVTYHEPRVLKPDKQPPLR